MYGLAEVLHECFPLDLTLECGTPNDYPGRSRLPSAGARAPQARQDKQAGLTWSVVVLLDQHMRKPKWQSQWKRYVL